MFLSLLLLSGCQTLSERKSTNKLEATLTSYGATVRWQPLAGIYSFLEPKLQPDSLPTNLDNIRVTNYEVTVAPRQLSETRATQTVAIEYVQKDRQVVHDMTDYQVWELSPTGDWLRANPIPSFH